MPHRSLSATLVLLLALLIPTGAIAAPKAPTSTGKAWVTETYVHHADGTHAGPGQHPGTESDSYSLTEGMISWFAGSTVEYRILFAPSRAAARAVEASAATIDGYVTTRAFARRDNTRQVNPCTGQPNTIGWLFRDGPNGVLAETVVCRNIATKEIGGFDIVVDTGDTWTTDGSAGTYDVQNVVTHEVGHAVGLGHVQAPKDGCLTMYTYSSLGEIQKRTLGLGDKLGLDKLYGHGDLTPGPGCGA